MKYLACSPRYPDGKTFSSLEDAREWCNERIRRGESEAGVMEVKE